MRKFFRHLRRDDGQALVELAFVLPLVILLLFGIIDFGLALNNYNSDTNLANIAARTASVSPSGASCGGSTQSTLLAYVKCEASAIGAPTPTSACVEDTVTGGITTIAAGDPIKVEVSSSFSWTGILTGKDSYIGKVVNPTSTFTATATMRDEQAPSGGASAFLAPSC